VNDGGEQYPSPACIQVAGSGIATGVSGYGLRTYGYGAMSFAQLGLSLRSGAPTCTAPLDASQAEGVRFFIRGLGPETVRLLVFTTATNPYEDGGFCTANCWQAYSSYPLAVDGGWHEYFVPFNELLQNSGAPFDPSQILNIVWQPSNLSCYDFTLDDVALY
jgi:hypothetical protein